MPHRAQTPTAPAASTPRRTVLRLAAALAVLAGVLVGTAGPAAAEGETCHGLPATIVVEEGNTGPVVGTEGADVIVGSHGDDEIHGLGGPDTICGRGGDDVIYAGPGHDWVFGGHGDDEIWGQGGKDLLRGGGGSDWVLGGRKRDRLFGDRSGDLLVGGPHPDRVRGGDGDDLLRGRDGDDWLRGGPGSDGVGGGADEDKCVGESVADCEMVEIHPGDSGPSVELLQQRLADALLYRGPVNGYYPVTYWQEPGRMMSAVYAFHKLHRDPVGDAWDRPDDGGDRVSPVWRLEDWWALDSFVPESPVDRPAEPNRIEVDGRHEVMWLILGGEVAGIFHVSIGGEYVFWDNGQRRIAHTPRGDFDIDGYSYGQKVEGYQYKSWWFEQNYYAVHGFYKVPPFPDSHGCVRVLYDEADWLTERLEVGWLVHVWDGY